MPVKKKVSNSIVKKNKEKEEVVIPDENIKSMREANKVPIGDSKYVPYLKRLYNDKIKFTIKEQFKLNEMEVPRLVKISINQGIGSLSGDKKNVEIARENLSNICCQKAVITKAKKAISNFKIKAGDNVGCMVTIRGDRMYDFLYRFINIVLPRIREFNGVSENSFDEFGLFNFGLKEIFAFPEVEYDKSFKLGMNISIQTTSRNKELNLALFKLLGFPFKKNVK